MSESVAVSENVAIRISRVIKAKRPRVFDSWTRPDRMHLWFAPGTMIVPYATVDLRIGGEYRIEMRNDAAPSLIVSGVYRQIVPNELLSFTWQWENLPGGESLVTVEFKDVEGGTEVLLTHEGLPNEESRQKHQQGWMGCLANLARLHDPNAETEAYNGSQ